MMSVLLGAVITRKLKWAILGKMHRSYFLYDLKRTTSRLADADATTANE